jgi:CBS domain containing-hemolysin-like protein
MTPRPDMRMAPAETTVDRMAVLMEEHKHSRIPIYEGGEDNVIGVVNSRTLLRALKDGRDSDPVKSYVHKAYFVPESKMVDDLLHDFQKKRTHLAIVIDEYGCTAGLVTIEDLLEEIVGEIWDEYDTEEPLYRWVDADTLRVDARIDIAELNDILDAEFNDDEEFETLGGLIFHTMGKVPKQEETVDIDGYEMKVERMVGRRIASVIIKRPTYPKQESENGEK